MKFSKNPKRLNTQTCCSPARVGNPPPIICLYLCYLKQLTARVPHPDTGQKSDGSAPYHNKTQRQTSPLPPLTHQHPCLCFQENSHCLMFWTGTSLSNCQESSQKHITCQQTYLAADWKYQLQRNFIVSPFFLWEVNWSWGMLFIPVRKNNWCCA